MNSSATHVNQFTKRSTCKLPTTKLKSTKWPASSRMSRSEFLRTGCVKKRNRFHCRGLSSTRDRRKNLDRFSGGIVSMRTDTSLRARQTRSMTIHVHPDDRVPYVASHILRVPTYRLTPRPWQRYRDDSLTIQGVLDFYPMSLNPPRSIRL